MGLPHYRRITNDLLTAMDSGILKPGDRIASIRELSAQYDVSQITVLRVFKELSRMNRIVRREGMGYFVKDLTKPENRSAGTTLILACRSPKQISEDDNFILRMTEGIHTSALARGLNVFIPRTVATIRTPVIDDAHMENLLRDILSIPNPAGIIIDMLYTDKMIKKYILPHFGNIPCVIAGRRSELPIQTVSLPFEKCADDAARLALKSGAQEFFIYEDSRNPWGGNSILCRSLQSLLIQAGVKKERIHYRDKVLFTRLRDMDLFQELKKAVSDSAHKVLAFSSSDYFSLAIMKELQNTCLFGRKASLISFGGFECMMKSDPPVTSIVPDARQIGILAVEQILKNDMNAYAANCQTDYKIELNRTL